MSEEEVVEVEEEEVEEEEVVEVKEVEETSEGKARAVPAVDGLEEIIEKKKDFDRNGSVSFRNRIKELRQVPAKELLSNPKNWRMHDDVQTTALRRIMDKVGFVDALLAREQEDGSLILVDGHLRKDLLPDEELPVLVLDITEKEADIILATHDGVTELATTDDAKLQELISSLDNETRFDTAIIYSDEFPDWYDDMLTDEQVASLGLGIYEDETPSVDLLPEELDGRIQSEEDIAKEEEALEHIWEKIFYTDLPYGIPEMDIDQCPTIPETENHIATFMGYNSDTDYLSDPDRWWFLLYGRESKSKQTLLPLDRTILAFYVDDWRFEGMWTNPVPSLARLKTFGLKYAVTPNFSLYGDFPMAVQLFNVYRSRWVGCAMQEAGIQVIPDIQWSNEASFEYCFLGIPHKVPCVSIQFQTRGSEEELELREKGLDKMMGEINPQSLILYGGKEEEVPVLQDRLGIPIKYVESRWDRLDFDHIKE